MYARPVLNGRSASSQTLKATLGVRELVFEGVLQRGDRVSEVALAERLGVSRTPLRIALATLAHEGLLEPLAGAGLSFARSPRPTSPTGSSCAACSRGRRRGSRPSGCGT